LIRTKLSYKLEKELYQWLTQLRKDGCPATITTIISKALKIWRADNVDIQGFKASRKWAYGFMKRWNLSLRTPSPLKASASLTNKYVRDVVTGFWKTINHHRRTYQIELGDIINIDEVPVPLDQVCPKVLERVGIKRAYVLNNAFAKERITVVLTTTAAGEFLKPMIIFKGTAGEGGQIFRTFQTDPELKDKFFFRQNRKAWMVSELWEEYLDLLFPNNKKDRLVIIDTAACHAYNHHTSTFNPEVHARLFDKKIHVALVPESCTPLVQPNDTHVNRPFKRRLQSLWSDFMIEKVDQRYENGKAVQSLPDMRRRAVTWVADALASIDKSVIQNGFQHCGISLALDGSEDHLCKVDLNPFADLFG
jgi:hypothetical protein